ncbi:MAG: metallophosphoesterase [Cyclobacteriaceae bacterium]|jgi:predicted MPP superfamily phosphohydrolase|nr:metallophosphoesterase [Flammeovirgaceae bacterium]
MTARLMTIFVFTIIFLLLDYYFFQGILVVSKNWSSLWKSVFRYGFWIPTILCVAVLFWWAFDDPYKYSANFRNWVITGIVAVYFSKVIGILFLLIDDVQRGVRWFISHFQKSTPASTAGEVLSRSEFLSRTAMIAASVPLGAFAYGIISGAHDYRVRKVAIKLPNLPKAFDGIRIAQISDIHSGSFWNKTAVKGGVEMILAEKPDVIFFTGDLVNNETPEVKPYIEVFDKLKAPLGVFSITGNHDYGDYKAWTTKEMKQRNFAELIAAHKELGFDLLMNENRFLEQGGEKLAILGVENWGTRFSKHGKLDEAYRGSEEAAVKLLLSHDPTHWDAQIRPTYKDIDVTFSGHTHGAQFGVNIGDFTWTPVQHVYKQWGGLYQEENQYLYVNRGFGYLGYPGRVGMPPEITVFELKRA